MYVSYSLAKIVYWLIWCQAGLFCNISLNQSSKKDNFRDEFIKNSHCALLKLNKAHTVTPFKAILTFFLNKDFYLKGVRETALRWEQLNVLSKSTFFRSDSFQHFVSSTKRQKYIFH